MSDTGIEVYIPEPGGGADDSDAFGKQLAVEFDTPFRFVSIGRGAAAAAWVTELIAFAQSPSGVATEIVTLFLNGERVEKSIDAWMRMYNRISATFHRRPTFDREGAAVLVHKAIADRIVVPVESTRCEGFEIIDRLSLGNPMEIPAPHTVSGISPRADKVANSAVYYFQVRANDRRFQLRGHDTVLRP